MQRLKGSGRSAVSSQVTGLVPEDSSSGEFGANEWLVDEMYERYIADKNSVDESWWPILESYHRADVTAPAPTGSVEAAEGAEAAAGAELSAGAEPSAGKVEAAVADPSQEPQIPEEVLPAVAAEAPADAAKQSAPAASASGSQPVARTTSVVAKSQPIPADAPRSAQPGPKAETATPVEDQNVVQTLRGMAK
ncbi:MAG: hypothetical protein LH605_11105, partial [Microbacteriaceae bacterium]|nr:hypothetical protein [Microbacteriaceae bacterium]